MSGVDLDAIQARAEAAALGPWMIGKDNSDRVILAGPFSALLVAKVGNVRNPLLAKDSEFIAHARTDVPALLALVREQQAKIERVQALHSKTCDISGSNCEAVADPSMKCTMLVCGPCGESWPCPTITALTETDPSND